MSTIDFLPNLYLDGLALSWVSNTKLAVSPGTARDSTNALDMISPTSVTIDCATNGVNGLDTGSLAASTVYYVFEIADPTGFNPAGFIASLSATAPLMPSGYGDIRYIGRARTNSSSQFLNFTSSGNGTTKTIQFVTPLSILSGGSQTSFTAIDCLIGAGIGVIPIQMNYAYTPANAANTASIRPTGSSAAALSCPVELKAAAAVACKGQFTIVPLLASGVPKIDYIVTSSDALTLTVQSFVEYL